MTAVIVMLILGAILGLGLGVAEKFLAVKIDERTEVVTGMLPGYNCGGCGYPGCSGLAEALVNRDLDRVTCRPAKADQIEAIKKYLAETPGQDGQTIELR